MDVCDENEEELDVSVTGLTPMVEHGVSSRLKDTLLSSIPLTFRGKLKSTSDLAICRIVSWTRGGYIV